MRRAVLTMPGTMWGVAVAPLRRMLARERIRPAQEPIPQTDLEDESFSQTAFTLALIGLCAQFAREGGMATRRMALVFCAVFPVPRSGREKVFTLFHQAYGERGGVEFFARQIRGLFVHRPALPVQVLERLFMLAASDGNFTDTRVRLLLQVAMTFGVKDEVFWEIYQRHTVPLDQNPYAELGVSPDADDAQVRQAHRRLLREYHPDGLAAHGFTRDDMAFAAARLAVVNRAFDMVARARGLI